MKNPICYGEEFMSVIRKQVSKANARQRERQGVEPVDEQITGGKEHQINQRLGRIEERLSHLLLRDENKGLQEVLKTILEQVIKEPKYISSTHVNTPVSSKTPISDGPSQGTLPTEAKEKTPGQKKDLKPTEDPNEGENDVKDETPKMPDATKVDDDTKRDGKKEIEEQYRRQLDDLVPKLSLPKDPSNYEDIRTAVDKTQDLKNKAKTISGLFTESVNELLKTARDNRDSLGEEKARLQVEMNTLELAALPKNYTRICQAIDRMMEVMPIIQAFGFHEAEYNRLLQRATSNKDLLTKRREQIIEDLQKLKPGLKVPMTPDNLIALQKAVEKMEKLKECSLGFNGVFTASNESDLIEASMNLKHLAARVRKMESARRQLDTATRERDYKLLKDAVKKAKEAEFIDKDDKELKAAKILLSFLNPEKRCAALKNAMDGQNIKKIERALQEMEEAGVINIELANGANRLLEKLKKQRRDAERQTKRLNKAKKALEKSFELAITSRDIRTLKQVLDEFRKTNFDDSDIPAASRAKALLRQLEIKEMKTKLQAAIESRAIDTLKKRLSEFKTFKDFNFDFKDSELLELENERATAEELLKYLTSQISEREKLRREITKMTPRAISEVHGYSDPPKPIFQIMKAVFTILGESQDAIQEWIKIQALMRKLDRDSIRKRVERFDESKLLKQTANTAGELLNGVHNLAEVRVKSKVAGMFYAWARKTVDDVKHRYAQQERSNLEVGENENEDA